MPLVTATVSFPPTLEKVKVGLSFSDFATERWKNEEQLMRKLLEEKGYEVISQEANHDVKLQRALSALGHQAHAERREPGQLRNSLPGVQGPGRAPQPTGLMLRLSASLMKDARGRLSAWRC